MKKNLLLALGLVAGMAAQAQLTESPWTGQPAPEENGTYFMYNVESGLWLQNNRKNNDYWTTYANVGSHGFDFGIIRLEDGTYQIDPKFGHNHSLNGWEAFGYMDTGQPLTKWTFTSSSAVSNGYQIQTIGETPSDYMVLAVDEASLDVDGIFGFWGTWQLVSKEERMADLEKATKDAPKDATWLIDDWDFANQNERNGSWKRSENSDIHIAYNQGWRGNRAVESWGGTAGNTGLFYQDIEGLPNGTYGVKLQGYYRDGSTGGVYAKHLANEEVIRGFYFANDVQAPLMSICDNGATEEIPDVFLSTSAFLLDYYWNPEIKVVVTNGTLRIGIGKNESIGDDWLCFDNFNLTYYGSEIDLSEVKENLRKNLNEAEAYEGTKLAILTAAIAAGNDAMNATEAETIVAATTNLQAALSSTIAMNASLSAATIFQEENEGQWMPPFFPAALTAANAALDTEDAAELLIAANELQDAVNNAGSAIENYGFLNATIKLAEKENISSSTISTLKAQADNAAQLSDVTNALNTLRTARKLNKVETHPDVFKGKEPSEGDPELRDNDFYLYNVGSKRFLCGGDDWGAHCAVGFPGQAVTLIQHYNAMDEPTDSFCINTHLPNGGENEYLAYNGYMDTGARDPWFFKAVEGLPGVYNITRRGPADDEGNVEDIMLGYKAGDFCVVHSDMKDGSDPNNQWKLVSREEREDLLFNDASATNPVDASFFIACPNFNQRDDDGAWFGAKGGDRGSNGIYGRGNNHHDFIYEAWNTESFTLNQYVEDLPVGWYRLSLTGYYRDGDHENQILEYAEGKELDPNYEPAQYAEFYNENDLSDEAFALLPNITEGIDLMPGMGDRGSARRDYGQDLPEEERFGEWQYIGEFPKWAWEATNWFQMGYYKTEILTEVTNSADGIAIAISKDDPSAFEADWIVVDNFRLTYFGAEKPENWRSDDPAVNVQDMLTAPKGDGKTYNLQGVQVVGKPKSGVYVRNGRKVIIK